MDARRRTVVVAFDVEGDRRRRRLLSRELSNHGQRVQRSVFECQLTPDEERQLRRRVAARVAPCDSVAYWRLPENACVRILGTRPAFPDPDAPFNIV